MRHKTCNNVKNPSAITIIAIATVTFFLIAAINIAIENKVFVGKVRKMHAVAGVAADIVINFGISYCTVFC